MKPLMILLSLLVFKFSLYAQWQIINEGETGVIGKIDFVNDSVGWMSSGSDYGASYELLKTEDFGITWSEVDLGEFANVDVQSMDFLSDTTGWLVFNYEEGKSGILFTQDGGNTWQSKIDTPYINLNFIFALDEQNVYAGHLTGTIIKTNNGGKSWINISPFDHDVKISSMWFFSNEAGVIIGRDEIAAKAFIARTFDGGDNWDIRYPDFLAMFNLQFLNDGTGYFTAYDYDLNNFFFETRDTCGTWSIKYKNEQYQFIKTYSFLSPDTVFSIIDGWEGRKRYLMFSADAGSSWKKRQLLTNGGESFLYFNDQGDGLITTIILSGSRDPGRITFRSYDGGNNWNVSRLTGPFTSAYFLDENNGFAAAAIVEFYFGYGQVFVTYDSGKNWDLSYSGHPAFALQFVDDSTGYFLTSSHHEITDTDEIWKTSDGGNNWDIAYKWHSGENEFSVDDLYFVDKNIGFAAGSIDNQDNHTTHPVIMGTIDGGQTWDNVWMSPTPGQLNSIFFKDTTGWAVGERGMVVKYTENDEWKLLGMESDLPLNDVFFSDENHAWIAGGHLYYEDLASVLLKTSNGGDDWQTIYFNDFLINDQFFSDSLTGWAVAEDTSHSGLLLHTRNGGESWDILNYTSAPLKAIQIKGNNGWVAGENGLILRTDDLVTWVDQSAAQKYPEKITLQQNYPNPFNPVTTIEYNVRAQRDVHLQHVDLSIYNTLGQKVATLVNKKQPAGSYQMQWDASGFAGGVYFYRLTTDLGFSETKKLLFLK